jgi:hypothetical protein
MPNPSQIDNAGRQIAGLLTYNPGPGIYSRLERAVEAMPENVRVQELPGLLKRYKDGVPGWELKAADLDSTIAGRDVVPREELLGAVRERSPVYTHKEVVLGGKPQTSTRAEHVTEFQDGQKVGEREQFIEKPVLQNNASALGGGVAHGDPIYKPYGQGGKDYTEVLLVQPGAYGPDFDSHWSHSPAPRADEAVAHARYDMHGDALRINEVQSDLGIHNRKMREQYPSASTGDPDEIVLGAGPGYDGDATGPLPFPMEDAWADVLIKRMALEAARQGRRAIEVASPRAIADKVGGNIDNYEHLYGKVVPGALERLGRKMGGLTEDKSVPVAVSKTLDRPDAAGRAEIRDTVRGIQNGDEYVGGAFWRQYNNLIMNNLPPGARDMVYDEFGGTGYKESSPAEIASGMYDELVRLGYTPQQAQAVASKALFEAPRAARLQHHYAQQRAFDSLGATFLGQSQPSPGRRYIMSDEMRRRLIQQGVGAAVAGGVLSQDDLIDRLNQ